MRQSSLRQARPGLLYKHDSLSHSISYVQRRQLVADLSEAKRRSCACRSKHSASVAERPSLQNDEASNDYLRPEGAPGGHTKLRSRSWKKTAHLKSKKQHVLQIEERERPLAEYMALPASQYSVLDAQKIERLDEDTFRCYVGGLQFFGIRVEPVLTVSVIVGNKGPTVKLLSTTLEGSSVAKAANDRFDATMTNVVTWHDPPGSGRHTKELESNAIIEVSLGHHTLPLQVYAMKQVVKNSNKVALEVPGWMRAFPVGAIEKTGSSVMQRVLNRMLPRFLAQLQADYELWASGDSSRTPIGTGQL